MATRKMNPNRRLLRLMKKHKLTQTMLVELCRCGRSTVHYWTREPTDPTFMPMKSSYLRLLELELGDAAPLGSKRIRAIMKERDEIRYKRVDP